MTNKYFITNTHREINKWFYTMHFRVHGPQGTMTMNLWIPTGRTKEWERTVYVAPGYEYGDTLFYLDAPYGVVKAYMRFAYKMVERMNAPSYEYRQHFYTIQEFHS